MMNFVFAGLYALKRYYDYKMMNDIVFVGYKMLLSNTNVKGKECKEENN